MSDLEAKLINTRVLANERQKVFRAKQRANDPEFLAKRATYERERRAKEKLRNVDAIAALNADREALKAAKKKIKDAIIAKEAIITKDAKIAKDVKIAKEANDTNDTNDTNDIKCLSTNIVFDDIKKQPLTPEGNIIKKGMIYIIEHNSNPTLIYVGKTTDGLNKRWNGHLSSFKQFNKMYYRLYFCVNYYGIENFSIREYKIYNNITPEYLDEEEKKYIFEMGTLNTQYSNNDITIKITNELRNELLNRLITKDTCISKLYKLIDTFSYDYKRDVLDFSVNDENKVLLNNLLKKELTDKLIDTDIQALLSNLMYTLSSKFLKDEQIIEDYIKYIDYFHNEFIITNNKEDTYYPDELVNILRNYGDHNELFDWYLIIDFKKILQHYFNILNKSYDNVKIDFKNNIIYGIKSKPLIFYSDGEY